MADIWLNVDSAVVVPLNILPFTDDTDFKSIETVVSASSLWVCWNFSPTAGSPTQSAFVPATIYERGNGIFTYNIPSSAGTINNDTEGFGWFTGSGVGLLPFRSPVYGFRASILNDNLIDNAYPLASASRVEAIQTTVNGIPTTSYTALISTRMSGSYLNSLGSASRVEAIYSEMAGVDDVWTSASRTLTSASGLNIASASRVEAIQTTVNSIPTTRYTDLISTRMSGSYLNSLASASRVEAIQTTVNTIPTTNYTDLISTRMSGSYLNAIASASVVSVIFDTDIDAGISFIEGMRVLMGVLFGNSTGGGTSEVTFKNAGDNTFNRIVATVDANGNRTVTLINGGTS